MEHKAAENSTSTTVIWLWKINKNDLWYFPKDDELENVKWTAYSDNETAYIEASFQKKEKAAIFNDFHIDFSLLMHISNWDDRRERLVKRIPSETVLQMNPTTHQKNQRLLPIPLLPSRSFARWREDDISCYLFYVSNHFNVRSSALQDPSVRRCMVENAAKGLIIEGLEAGKEMAKKLLGVKDGTLEQVTEKCAALYTAETFLYHKLNEFMRSDGDKTEAQFVLAKIETLGPFAFLLSAIPENGCEEKMTVYRSVVLTEDMIEQYRESEGRNDCVFPAFTSTSRNREIADFYGGNVILKIDIIPRYDAVDVTL